jgi:hypothetical protein
MKKLILFSTALALLLSCEKDSGESGSYLTARIAGFDLNCSTCILEFPEDNQIVMKEIGQSPENYYGTINLNKNDYQVGQMLKVRIRKPETDELKPCITLYPSYDYKNVYVTDFEKSNNLILGDTVTISYNECLCDPENQIYVCLDTVLNDSRCPTGVQCFWEGNATVRFRFSKVNAKPVLFELNTHRGFTYSIIISGYRFTLTELKPYPVRNNRIEQKEYKAELVIEKE